MKILTHINVLPAKSVSLPGKLFNKVSSLGGIYIFTDVYYFLPLTYKEGLLENVQNVKLCSKRRIRRRDALVYLSLSTCAIGVEKVDHSVYRLPCLPRSSVHSDKLLTVVFCCVPFSCNNVGLLLLKTCFKHVNFNICA